MSLHKLNNVIQNYAWGSIDSMQQLFNYPNPKAQPQAELWMGAHPNGCSTLADNSLSLADAIQQQPTAMLGKVTYEQFGELPYLFKVLAADKPLSIQVHPSKAKAKLGFDRENQQNIPLNAPNRNYKDPNHKPELVYALTEYHAMNGFRPLPEIIALFNEIRIDELSHEVSKLTQTPNADSLESLFSYLLRLEGAAKQNALNQLYTYFERTDLSEIATQALTYSKNFTQYYQDDVGLFAPLLLNIVVLQPGEAMFLYAETPHAYLKGTGLEIMANSDNVLRAGLTPKYIDIDELIANTCFDSQPSDKIKMSPLLQGSIQHYPIPVADFNFDIINIEQVQSHNVDSAEILFCLSGEVKLSSGSQALVLTKGESLFISFDSNTYQTQGHGQLARAYN